jgi:MFS family permease
LIRRFQQSLDRVRTIPRREKPYQCREILRHTDPGIRTLARLGAAAACLSSSAFRLLQGAGGGGLQPVSQAILKDSFPPEQLGTAFAIYGMVVVFAPAIGPIIGGWIPDNYQWRRIFYMNVPIGMLSLLLVSRLVEDPAYLSEQVKKARKFIDYIGISLLGLCLGSLQIVRDKGQENNWFRRSSSRWL